MSQFIHYSIEAIQEEARWLVEQGAIARKQSIYVLLEHLPAREWVDIERELEQSDFLLRDRIDDLLSHSEWSND